MSSDTRNLPHSFRALDLSHELQDVVSELGYQNMTPIQAASIPLLLAGKDVIGQAQTGSGKTAAFTLPILQSLEVSRRRVQALILCPTRELCAQVASEARKLGRRHPGLQVLTLAGGQPARPQLFALERGVQIVVGTPGRVLDLLTRKKLDLGSCRWLVLDEADRMLDMGFAEEMKQIFGFAPSSRQTVFFSATFPGAVAEMSKAYQKNAEHVMIAAAKHEGPAIRQIYFEADHAIRARAIRQILEAEQPESALVFCNMKATVANLAAELVAAGMSVGALHGDLEQYDRDRVLAKFRNQSVRVLVATDVASRGLDVEHLDLVINYELPSQTETYVHRIGRTGRAGKKGVAISLCSAREKFKLQNIEGALGLTIERRTLDSLRPSQTAKKTPGSADSRPSAMVTLMISGGRKDKLRPGDILGALTGEAGGVDGAMIGKIEIHDRFSYVAISKEVSNALVRRLQDGRIKGRTFHTELVN